MKPTGCIIRSAARAQGLANAAAAIASQAYIQVKDTNKAKLQVVSNAPNGQITVPANATADVTVTVTLSEADRAYIDERFPYGSYVEGFVQLLSDSTPNLSVPFLAFYGDFGEGPVLEEGPMTRSLGR